MPERQNTGNRKRSLLVELSHAGKTGPSVALEPRVLVAAIHMNSGNRKRLLLVELSLAGEQEPFVVLEPRALVAAVMLIAHGTNSESAPVVRKMWNLNEFEASLLRTSPTRQRNRVEFKLICFRILFVSPTGYYFEPCNQY